MGCAHLAALGGVMRRAESPLSCIDGELGRSLQPAALQNPRHVILHGSFTQVERARSRGWWLLSLVRGEPRAPAE